MQFKHPELLWALLLLLIPIIIHLFQLRRFKKVAFTNVKFLKNVKLKTRKSSQIKKWLTLITRLLLLACLIFAFSQPFTTKSDKFNTKNETVIYLDNSYSMQAKGNNGTLLNETIQDLLDGYSNDEEITIFTNEETYRNTTVKDITNDLINLGYSSNQLDYKSLYLKGKQYFRTKQSATKNLILVSDFQQKSEPIEFESDTTINLKLVQPKAVYKNNVSIDSVYISKYNSDTIDLGVVLSNSGEPIANVAVALHNNKELVAKTSVDLPDEETTSFTIPNNVEFDGVLSIDDAGLQYDNKFYFNFNTPEKINVLSINEASDNFLKRIYTDDEFNYIGNELKNLDYSKIEDQNLIILNEINTIPNALITVLKSFVDDGGSTLIISSDDSDLKSYNQLLTKLKLPSISKSLNIKKRVTKINYDHPLISDAFYNRVSNFQYPKVNKHYKLSSYRNSVYSFEDNSPFLLAKNKTYLFTSAINSNNSNFKKSPLIVPALYNIGKQSLAIAKLYYTIGNTNVIDINTQLDQDDILSLESNGKKVIPLQQTYSKKVSLITNDFPNEAGVLQVKDKTQVLRKLSFNYKRDESNLIYHNLSNNDNYTVDNTLSETIERIKIDSSINALWKWFVIFALAFLIVELLILKFFK